MPPGGDTSQERTEDPTEKRKEEAREKGQAPLSRDASTVIIFLAAVGAFVLFRHATLDAVLQCMRHFLSFGGELSMGPIEAQRHLRHAFAFSLQSLAPLFMMVFVAAAVANLAQIGFIYAPSKLEPKFDKLDPIAGLRKLLSLRQLMEGAKSVLKVALIGTIVYFIFCDQIVAMGSLTDMTPAMILEEIIVASLRMTWKVALFLIVLGILDFSYQRWEHLRSLRMSRQEIKDEMREREGDPLIKQRIRQIQAERARQRMMEQVKTADVIITNPTRLAIALKYERDKMRAPRVVAKGANLLAERIRNIAREHGIPLVENKPVAHVLYRTVKVGQEVPSALYKAIAGILAYVYKTAKRKPAWV
jgi:flagellar biosynthetic protein FlhB